MERQTRATSDQTLIYSDEIRAQRGWFIALGVLMMLLGVAAIAFPFTATLAVTITVGAVLVISGIAQLVHAFGVHKWRGFLITLLGAMLSLAVGVMVLFYPVSGILSFTLLLGSFLLVGGVLKTILAFRVRPGLNWGWLLFAGLTAALLGMLILLQWPFAAGWVLGLLVGIDLVFSGWWMLAIALATRRVESRGEQQPTQSNRTG